MSENRRSRRKKISKTITIVLKLMLILGIVLLIKSIITEHIENEMQKEVSRALETIDVSDKKKSKDKNGSEDIITERMLQVQELKKENEDIVGWIDIKGTNINYPVLQGEDNEYYLKHNYKHQYISTGSIFLDRNFDFNIPSTNLLIYGHRNRVRIDV